MSHPITTVELELPIGYEDSQGTFHTSVVMRKVKNSDTIAVQNDVVMKGLVKEYSKMDLAIDQFKPDPVKAMVVNSLVAQMFTLLFCRIIIKLGDVDPINKKVVSELYQEDMQFLMRAYGKLNGVDIDSMMENPPLAEN